MTAKSMKMIGLENFKRDLKKFSQAVGLEEELLVKKVALDAFKGIVGGTPIDTGRAMNNWVISVGSERLKEYKTGGKREAILQRKISQAEKEIGKYQRGQVVYITNSLVYIVFLNEGSSKQAPSNFVQTALNAAAAPLRI